MTRSYAEFWLCGEFPWGIWVDGTLSLCFQETVLLCLNTLFIVLLTLYHVRSLYWIENKWPAYSWLFIYKLIATSWLAVVPFLTLLVRTSKFSSYMFEFFSDSMYSISWTMSGIIVIFDFMKAKPHHWSLRVWYLTSFLLGSLKMQTIVHAEKFLVFNWTFALFVVHYFCITSLAILGLFVNLEYNIPVDQQLLETKEQQTSTYRTFSEEQLTGNITNPENNAGFFSRLTFYWLDPLLRVGSQRSLVEQDLPNLSTQDSASHLYNNFNEFWQMELKTGMPSLARAIRRAFGFQFGIAAFWRLLHDALNLSLPMMLNLTIRFIQSGSTQPLYLGFIFVFCLFFFNLLAGVFEGQYFHIAYRSGLNLRSALVSVIYRKALVLSPLARQKTTSGEIVNLMSLDASRFQELSPLLHMLWASPLLIIVCFGLIWSEIGVSTIAGVSVMALMIPLNTMTARKLMQYQKTVMTFRDKRVKLMNEILQGIRILKFFVWENSFIDKIAVFRNEEVQLLKRSAFLRAFVIMVWAATPLFVSVSSFTMFTLLGNTLTPEKAFTALALFNVMRFPMNMLPNVITSFAESLVSMNRIQQFLLAEELDPDAINKKVDVPSVAVRVNNGSFSWDRKSENLTLQDINFEACFGELFIIVGAVGSGKSSLISALLGEIPKLKGTVEINGRIAYVPQQAWMQNNTLCGNILFGRTFDQKRYEETINCCELLPDIAALSGGDMTEIGEKGINLSGGQKQRISIARAMYSDADIYLFDDPLSAVDAHVGHQIFNNCILGALKNKTRILVTHQLQHLPNVNATIIVMKNGKILEMGSYQELMKTGQTFSELINVHLNLTNSTTQEKSEKEIKTKSTKTEKESSSQPSLGQSNRAKLMTLEERTTGSVGYDIYLAYFSAMGISMILSILVFLFFEQALAVSANIWLSMWSNANSTGETSTNAFYYLSIYVGLGLSGAIFVLFRALGLAIGGVIAGKRLHEQVLRSVLFAPVSFFDTTPVGRILNRFGKDVYTIDEQLRMTLNIFLAMSFNLAGILFIIAFVTPFILVGLLPLTWLYAEIRQYYIRSSLEIKRLDSISRSPIFAHFGETLNGSQTIRAYNLQERFIENNESKLDVNQRAIFFFNVANRWVSVRLQTVGSIIIALAGIFVVAQRGYIDPGQAGLSLAYCLQITTFLNLFVRMSAELETYIVSVERMVEYERLPQEAPHIIEGHRPSTDWPSEGMIEFKNVMLRYREDLDLVLKGISASIHSQEKIGVVGRTGAGKSSLILALFRIVEHASGTILIDDIDINSIGLADLRSKISIIPQDPTIFVGTIRSNLDPLNQHTDHAIWDALAAVDLKTLVSSFENGLESAVVEFGENLSVGQRQLMCLARALLMKTKILILDEATAAVDFETDAFIQKTIRSRFADRTVLTIAHRINTIIDSDRVMVLDKGKIAEFDKPSSLIENPNSIFYSLAKNAGLVN